MQTDFVKAVELLNNGNYTCVLCSGDTVFTSAERGVKPLLDFLDGATDLNGFSAADKVVGKAAAFLYVLLGVKQVYARVLSESALAVFEKYGIECKFEKIAASIINRAGNGICPMESAVTDISSPAEALEAIRRRLYELNRNRAN